VINKPNIVFCPSVRLLAKSGQTEHFIPEQTEHMIPEMAEHLKPELKHHNINSKQ